MYDDRSYQCPNCDTTIMPSVHGLSKANGLVQCPECKKYLTIDYDAEFVDGRWRDLTKLFEYKGSLVV
jgi:predicted Zn finger-like uncharacterized protein